MYEPGNYNPAKAAVRVAKRLALSYSRVLKVTLGKRNAVYERVINIAEDGGREACKGENL